MDGGWMEDGGWRMEDGGWRMEDRGWRMEDGRMEDGGWTEDGRWRMDGWMEERWRMEAENVDFTKQIEAFSPKAFKNICFLKKFGVQGEKS